MMPTSFGDRAHSYQLAQQNSQLKTALGRLSQELSSGQTANKSEFLNGNFSNLAAFEKANAALAAHKTTNTEAAFFLETAQASLSFIQNTAQESAAAYLTASASGNVQITDAAIGNAKTNLESVLSALNTRAAGQSIFAGTATNQNAIIDAETILTELGNLIAAEINAADAMTLINDWFDTPAAGFDTIAYTGSANKLGPIPIGANQSASFQITAQAAEIRTTIKGFAIAALVSDGALSGYPEERGKLLQESGETLLTAEAELVSLSASVGHTQNHVENIANQNRAEKHVLDIAMTNLLGKDPYETAAELQSVQTQLEALYTVTARISQLSLMDFLR